MTTTTTTGTEGLEYAAAIRAEVDAFRSGLVSRRFTGEWSDYVMATGRGWDLGPVRLFVDDVGARSVTVYTFTPAPARLLDSEVTFTGVAPAIVAEAIVALYEGATA